jgi:hypothetical protein
MADIVQIMDFAADDITPEFRVGQHHFKCVPDIPLGLAQQVANFKTFRKELEETGSMEPLLELFDQLLEDEETGSATRFRECIKAREIGIKRISKIIPWILEEYGLGHPTQPSSPSSDGLSDGETGPTSPAGAFPSALALGGSH